MAINGVQFLERFRWDSLWGGVLEGEVAEVLKAFEVGVAGQIADAAVEVESELGGEGGGVGGDGGGDGGFGQGSTEGPAAEEVPGGDFGDPFEFD
jgi:hypothetical protein